MSIEVTTVDDYAAELPEERRAAFGQLLSTIRQNIDPAFEEVLNYGMPSWVVPHSVHPAGYHCDPKLPVPFLSLGNQKNYIALYHMGIYSDPATLDWFQQAYRGTGYKLDMGKSCIRFKKMEQIPCELIAELMRRITLREYLDNYVSMVQR
ncbi:MAG TPA: DUF1801 domain-containing protein [Arthrobacter sp.]|nr:DUF1801 domain-containing protein [Arthrobacter sp.]